MNAIVVGAYLPRLDPERLARYVAEDKWRYINVAVSDLRSKGFLKDFTDDYVLARAQEIADETQRELQQAALFEIEVTDNNGTFDVSEIESAWEPSFLSPDGAMLLESLGQSPANSTSFRVAFWVHEWSEGNELVGSSGSLGLPEFSSVPERLWTLAPYALVD
ncbi:hypothetical protein [Methylibium petroleiphilum]|uniref:hypothetical protein n=1 Tax=Methylibium petroleiphilum TaxID=105560 RepID=UPI003D293149